MQRQHYPTDPTDTEWRYLVSHFSTERARERPRKHPLRERELLGAIFTSCAAVAPDVRLRTVSLQGRQVITGSGLLVSKGPGSLS